MPTLIGGTTMFDCRLYAITPGRDLFLGHARTRFAYVTILGSSTAKTATGISVHGKVNDIEYSGEMDYKTAMFISGDVKQLLDAVV
jgi:hypothetical protein